MNKLFFHIRNGLFSYFTVSNVDSISPASPVKSNWKYSIKKDGTVEFLTTQNSSDDLHNIKIHLSKYGHLEIIAKDPATNSDSSKNTNSFLSKLLIRLGLDRLSRNGSVVWNGYIVPRKVKNFDGTLILSFKDINIIHLQFEYLNSSNTQSTRCNSATTQNCSFDTTIQL